MSLRVGVVGCGAIGSDHIRRIMNDLSGAEVVAVSDLYRSNAEKSARLYPCKVFETGEELISSHDVEAVIVTTTGATHKQYVMATIKAGKPVFCEKPLATTAADSLEIVEAEVKSGKHLVQVGFMRRYDKGYQQLKTAIDNDTIGLPLLLHCTHRNPAVDKNYTTDMAITDTAIHEIDALHWLLNDEYESVQVLFPRKSRNSHDKLQDPQIVIFTTKTGVIAELEINVNCQFGYDIQCQVVGECGTAALPDPSNLSIRKDAKRYIELLTNWKDRFMNAYDTEIQQWINTTFHGTVEGPTAWDGYVAAVTADACVKAQHTGQIEKIDFGLKPAFYGN